MLLNRILLDLLFHHGLYGLLRCFPFFCCALSAVPSIVHNYPYKSFTCSSSQFHSFSPVSGTLAALLGLPIRA